MRQPEAGVQLVRWALPIAVVAVAGSAAMATDRGFSAPPVTLQDSEIVVASQQVQFMHGNVLGVDSQVPRFSWQLATATQAAGRDNLDAGKSPDKSSGVPTAAKQAQIQLNVFAAGSDAVLWTSGPVGRTVPYYTPLDNPIPFKSDTLYEWEVVVGMVNASGSGSSFNVTSQRARFQTGLMSQTEWEAQWIAGGNMYRTEVAVSADEAASSTRATVFVSACQYYQLYINGQRVSDAPPDMGSVGYGPRELDVGWTDFDHNRSYATLDVPIGLLLSNKQANGPYAVAIGMMVGMGFCPRHEALLQLQLSGSWPASRVIAATNNSTWTVSAWGPILADSTYYGETYDARKEQPGFASPGFVPPQGSTWAPAEAAGNAAAATHMSAQMMQPIRRVADRTAVSFSQIAGDRFVYDFGQEAAGWARLTLPPGVPAGTNATLKFAEALQHEPFGPRNGSVWMGNLFWAYPVDHFIARGSPGEAEVYEPRFTYHGFRYVEVLFVPPLPAPLALEQDSLTMVVLRTSAATTSAVRLSDPTLQGISRSSWWTEAAALMSIPAGCAGRGERNGWIGDAAFASQSELFDFDSVAMYSQWLLQVRDAQCPDGGILNGVPSARCTERWQYSDPSWQTVYPTLASNLARFHGASDQLREHYPHLQLYMRFLRSNYTSRGMAVGYSTWGDWNPAWPEPRNGSAYTGPVFVFTSPHITASASYVHDHLHMADVASALGLAADESVFRQQLAEARTRFHQAFFDEQQGWYGDGTVVAQAVALWIEAVPPQLHATVVNALVSQVAAQNYSMASVGFIGVRYLFEALSRVNRTDVALKMLVGQEYPSYGFAMNNQIEPATTLWESADVFSMAQWLTESSRDHHYQASISTYVRQYVVGLDSFTGTGEGADGASTWAFRPEAALVREDIVAHLDNASIAARTTLGDVSAAWSFPLGRGRATAGIPPHPLPMPPRRTCAVVPQFPVPNGGLRSPFRSASLECPAGSVVRGVEYALFGRPTSLDAAPWTCYGKQPPPQGLCQADVSELVLQACANRSSCTLNATADAFGNPCNLAPPARNALPPAGYQLAVRVTCAPAAMGSALTAGEDRPLSATPSVRITHSGSRLAPDSAAAAVVFRQQLQVPVGSNGQLHVPIFSESQRISTPANETVWQGGDFVPGSVVPGLVPAAGVTDTRFVHFDTVAGAFELEVWL
jgi:alpha-L-rhamnosidase